MEETFWHNLDLSKVVKKLDSDIDKGLSAKEVEVRRKKYGPNKLPEEKPLSGIRLFLEQFQSPLIYILLFAGIITLFLKEYTDAIIIFGAVLLDTIVGFLQENKASKSLMALKKVVKYEAEVLRGGNLKIIDSTELVPGDIIILNPGNKVPADGRIIESHDLKINEMALTGEWMAAKKTNKVLPKETPLADRDNMVYMGTIVEDGKGKVIITETGAKTEIGKVATMIKETREEKTPYQKKLADFSKKIGIIIGIICLIIFIEGMLTEGNFVEMFTTSIAIAVAAIPEGLPVAMTVILAVGMQRILTKKGLVRKLASAETLGSTSVICTDKTATLTEGKMKASEIIGNKDLTIKAASLTSEAFVENPDEPKDKWIIRGRPTDRALFEAGIEAGINKRLLEKNKVSEILFNSINKFSAALYKENDKHILYVCGAPEKILEFCVLKEEPSFIKTPEAKEEKIKWQKTLEEVAQKGLRVVACAYKEIENSKLEIGNLQNHNSPNTSSSVWLESLCENLVFAGLITLKDPIRPEVKEAMRLCRRAGMRPIIVTGDHKLTAKAVAEELGFRISDKNILEGKDLERISDEELDKVLPQIQIYARVEPKHKVRIVKAWQKRGEVVAMTGDGINDAPALKKADIGVAVGSGTEVAKETADLILLNDSFSIIVAAVEEGRAILDNIRKVITYLLGDSFCEVILIGGSMVISWFTHKIWILPVTAVQILWTNLIEDGLPDIALAFEPKEKDLMSQKPGKHNVPLLTREMKTLILIAGLVDDILLLGLFFWLLKFSGYSIIHVRSIMLANLATDTIYYAFSCKSLRRNLWHINPFSNKFLNIAFIMSAILLFATFHFPPLQKILETEALYHFDWALVLGLTLIDIIVIEATKWYFISRHETQ